MRVGGMGCGAATSVTRTPLPRERSAADQHTGAADNRSVGVCLATPKRSPDGRRRQPNRIFHPTGADGSGRSCTATACVIGGGKVEDNLISARRNALCRCHGRRYRIRWIGERGTGPAGRSSEDPRDRPVARTGAGGGRREAGRDVDRRRLVRPGDPRTARNLGACAQLHVPYRRDRALHVTRLSADLSPHADRPSRPQRSALGTQARGRRGLRLRGRARGGHRQAGSVHQARARRRPHRGLRLLQRRFGPRVPEPQPAVRARQELRALG